MNYWTDLSIELATQRDYLDQLFKVYPLEAELIKRDLKEEKVAEIMDYFNTDKNSDLLKALLKLEKFPINDSYVGFLKSEPKALVNNPKTILRLTAKLKLLGIEEILKRSAQPKETNTQIGPMFKKWMATNPLQTTIFTSPVEFESSKEDGILLASDGAMKSSASRLCNYNQPKGLDFLGRFNKKLVIGEAKFISAEGGNQRNQIRTTRQMLDDNTVKALRIAIFDGIIYLPKHKNLLSLVADDYNPHLTISSLLLSDYVYSL